MDNQKLSREEDIDLLKIIKYLFEKRKFIFIGTIIGILLGVVFIMGSRKEYKATCEVLPESLYGEAPSLGGGLGSLAGLAGIDLNTNAVGALTPELYPEIVFSTSFINSLIKEPIYFRELDSTYSSYEYLSEIQKPTFLEYGFSIPSRFFGLFKSETKKNENQKHENSRILDLSKKESDFINTFKKRVFVSIEKKSSIIEISVLMPDPYAAAQLTDILYENLQKTIIDYKLKKLKLNQEFIEERFFDAKSRYEFFQKKLAKFSDENKNVITSIARLEKASIQNELNIAFEVYKGLASQLEQSKIKIKEKTPIFTVVEPISIPVNKSKPKGSILLIVFAFLGMTMSVGILLIKKYIIANE